MSKLSKKLSHTITLTVSIRVLSVALVVFVAIFSFLVYGAYQGIQSNHNNVQQLHAQRVAQDAATKALLDASFCDVVYYFDGQGVAESPFIEHVRQVHNCASASVHVPAKPGAVTSTTPPPSQSKSPTAGGEPGGQTSASGHNGPVTTGPSSVVKPKPSPTPERTPTPPKKLLDPILQPIAAPVCKLLNPVLKTCILVP